MSNSNGEWREKGGRDLIIVTGYPKSGTTWLTRLIADSLDCPAGGSHPSEDKKDVASEGWNRKGPYLVRKGHYRLVSHGDKLIPRPHQLAMNHVTQRLRMVHIIRDPRDVAVSSASYHANRGLDETLTGMVEGTLYNLPPWSKYVLGRSGWVVSNVQIKYEDLLADTEVALERLLYDLFIWDTVPDGRLKAAVRRQSFKVKKQSILETGDKMMGGKDLNLRMLRKGVSGSWKDEFSSKQLKYAKIHWEEPMEQLGYGF